MIKAQTSSKGPGSTSKVFGARIPKNLAKAIKILGVEESKSVQEIMIEALQDVLVKYGKKVPKD